MTKSQSIARAALVVSMAREAKRVMTPKRF